MGQTLHALVRAGLTDRGSSRSGSLVLRGDGGLRGGPVDRVFNRRLTDRPAGAVLRPATEHDVVHGVRLARERGWQVAVRSGGHSWAQWSVRDEALRDRPRRAAASISYDEATGIVTRLAGGAGRRRAGAVPRRARPVLPRRALPDRRPRRLPAAGRPGLERPRLGLGGRVRRGGRRRHRGRRAGPRPTPTQNADLYWAARGAGPGFFGVVTRFHLRTLPAPGARRPRPCRPTPSTTSTR